MGKYSTEFSDVPHLILDTVGALDVPPPKKFFFS